MEFNIMHPQCQTSSILSVGMRLPLWDHMAAVSEDTQDIPHDIPVLGLILPNI
jgi:hypothetical protein